MTLESSVHHDYDAIVIGGGPAGSFAALTLARARARVLLVDRRGPGQGKCCGHCLNPRALPLLREAGLLARVKAIAHGETCRLILRTAQHVERTFDLAGSGDEPGLIVPRESFDDLILRAAEAEGVDVVRRASAAVWRSDPSGVVVEIHEREARRASRPRRGSARLVVGADGLRSGVARSMGLASMSSRAGGARGLSFDLRWNADDPGVCMNAIDSFFPAGAIVMHVTAAGYVGVARCGPRRLHVGALVRRRTGRHESEMNGACGDIASILRSFPRVWRALEPGLARTTVEDLHAAAPMPWRARQVGNGCAALVGDAAGYAEPFTGEGLSWALEGASLLARAATATGAFAWGFEPANKYAHEWRATIGRRVARCGRIGWLLRSRTSKFLAPCIMSLAPMMVRGTVREIGARPMELAS